LICRNAGFSLDLQPEAESATVRGNFVESGIVVSMAQIVK
jgi:hypothetical protein